MIQTTALNLVLCCNPFKKDQYSLYAKADKKTFASGSFRKCYKGNILSSITNKHTCTNDFPAGECVIKCYSDKNNVEDFKKDIACLLYARSLSSSFNKKIGEPNKINYVKPYISTAYIDGIQDNYILIEPYIKGTFRKFYNNDGSFVEQEDSKKFNKTIPAFSHYTWLISGKNRVITDLQGVYKNEKYYLTDPAIQSFNHDFGNSDLGACGILKFILEHKCSSLCRDWPMIKLPKLKKFLTDNDANTIKLSSFYNYIDDEKYKRIYQLILKEPNLFD